MFNENVKVTQDFERNGNSWTQTYTYDQFAMQDLMETETALHEAEVKAHNESDDFIW